MSDTPILQIENLSTYYGAVQALRSVSLTVQPGEICAVLGANGAGKTTLLRTISGLQPAAPGSRILVNGEDITGAPAESMVRRGLAHVPEGGGVIVDLTVEENLRLGGLWRADRRDRPKPSTRSTNCSRPWWSGATSPQPPFPAGNAKWSPSAGP